MALLLNIAKSLARDSKNGGSSAVIFDIGASLVNDPEAGAQIIGLILKEGRKKRPDAVLSATLLKLLEACLTFARQDCENHSRPTHSLIEGAKQALRLALKGETQSDTVMRVFQAFSAAQVDLGEDLKWAMFEAVEEEGLDEEDLGLRAQNVNELLQKILEIAETIAIQSNGDAFTICEQLQEIFDSIPVEAHAPILSALAQSKNDAVCESLLGFLLARDLVTAQGALSALSDLAEGRGISSISLSRLTLLRNWIKAPLRMGVDALARAERIKKHISPVKARAPIQVEDVLASPRDGVGAQNWFLCLRHPRKYSVAAFLTKDRFGLRDAWLRHGLSASEARSMLAEVENEIEVFSVSLASIEPAVENGLFEAMKADGAIPFALVDLIEGAGLGAVSPKRWSALDLVAWLANEHEISDLDSDAALEKAQACSLRWVKEQSWLQSWFEEGDGVAEIAMKGKNKKERAFLLIKQVIEPHRQFWGENLAWTALAARDSAPIEDFNAMLTIARKFLGDRALEDCALARHIAQQTLEALKSPRSLQCSKSPA